MDLVSLRHLTLICALILAATAIQPAAAQSAPASAQSSANANANETPAARPADVSSMNAIIKAVYDVISGPKGQERDWDRMRSLFVPGARLISARAGKDGATTAHVMSVEDYIRLGGPMLQKDGFFEREAHRTEDRYGTSPRCSARTNHAIRRMPSRSSAVSTAFNCCSTANAGGW